MTSSIRSQQNAILFFVASWFRTRLREKKRAKCLSTVVMVPRTLQERLALAAKQREETLAAKQQRVSTTTIDAVVPPSLQERLALGKRQNDHLLAKTITLKKARTECVQSCQADFCAPAALTTIPFAKSNKPQVAKPKPKRKAKSYAAERAEDQASLEDTFSGSAHKARAYFAQIASTPKPRAAEAKNIAKQSSASIQEMVEDFSLQFIYKKLHENDERETFVACTPTSVFVLAAPFDFANYAKNTQTPPFPPKFQELVQRAIQHELHPPAVPPYSLEGFTATLTAKQVLALEFLLARPYCLEALPTGLGKTAIGFAAIITQWAQMDLDNSATLVLCPAGLRFDVWLDEGRDKFIKGRTSQVVIIDEIATAQQKLSQCPDARVVVVSYTMLASISAVLLKRKWHMIIADEAHYLQSSKSQCSQVVMSLRPHVKRVVLMSATPCDNTIVYYNLMRILEPDLFKHFFHFKPPHIHWQKSTEVFYYVERFGEPEKVYTANGGLKWKFSRSARRNELHALCRQFVLEQDKQEALPDVLPLVYESIQIGAATDEQKAAFQKAMLRVVDVEKKQGATSAQALFMEQVRLTAINKLPLVLAYIKNLLDTTPPTFKFIVWGYHQTVLESISASLDALGAKHILIFGKTPKKKRAALIEQLKNDAATRIGVLSLACCGTGQTFTFLQVTIYAELIFSFKIMCQSEGRTYRMTQTGQAIARYLMLANSTDDVVWRALQRKRDNESVILRNKHAKITLTSILAALEPLMVTNPIYEDEDDTPNEAEQTESDLLAQWISAAA